jgi:methylthioribulose-1-phosphate dehydratase
MEIKKLVDLIHALNRAGHNPATSGNYSLRKDSTDEYVFVSQSGIDKGLFNEAHFLLVDMLTGELHPSLVGSGKKSSDETLIHLAIYQETKAKCILHSHSLDIILFAEKFSANDEIKLTNLEILKAFKGVKSHEETVVIPCFDNTQHMVELASKMKPILKVVAPTTFAMILKRHGIYVWGSSVEEAKRHLEATEYVAKFYLEMHK